ncbi:hypothetical protein KID03_03270 [bacterium]|nr:hypothetical protein [bacterium]
MFFNRYRAAGNDYNECVARGSCSTSPEIRSLQEVILIFLRQLAFYELKLDELNASYFENKDTIIEGVVTLIATGEYSHEQMLEIVSKIYSKMLYARKEYLNFCSEHNLKCEDLKFTLKLNPKMTLPDIIQSGEKAFLLRYKKISPQQKNLNEILVMVIKSVSANLIRLKEYDKFDDVAYKNMLNCLNSLNYPRTSADKIKENIDNLARIDINLIDMLEQSQKERFGEITKKLVPQTTKPGKAVLVSGTNLQNLYEILQKSKDMKLDIYTHSDLLIGHAFSVMEEFKNLKGHYGSCFSNCVLDFATFPGAILLTKNTYPNIEYLYRGKLFSAEEIPPKGVIQIKEDDYSPLFEAAMEAKGFTHGREVEPVEVGYDKEETLAKIHSISEKINSGEIEHLLIIGLSDNSDTQEEYFRKLYALLPEKSFVITFSYHYRTENELYVNLVNNLPEAYNLLKEIFALVPVNSENISFFFTKCDANSISNIINLSNLGAKHIYLTQCPPYVINPNLLSTLKSLYHIMPTTVPSKDIEKILAE